MNITLAQVFAVIRYEILMQWRRRTLIVLCGFFLVGLIGLGTMLDPLDLINTSAEIPGVNTETLSGTWATLSLILPGTIVLLLAIMPMLAEIIPLDQQYKVDQLIGATTLTRAAYLIGKLGGVWIGLIVGLIISAVALALLSTVRFGALDVWVYARFWSVFVVLPALICSGLVVMLAALMSSRRGAVVLGIALLPFALTLGILLLTNTYLFGLLRRLAELVASGATQPYEQSVNEMLQSGVVLQLPFALLMLGAAVIVYAVLRAKGA